MYYTLYIFPTYLYSINTSVKFFAYLFHQLFQTYSKGRVWLWPIFSVLIYDPQGIMPSEDESWFCSIILEIFVEHFFELIFEAQRLMKPTSYNAIRRWKLVLLHYTWARKNRFLWPRPSCLSVSLDTSNEKKRKKLI